MSDQGQEFAEAQLDAQAQKMGLSPAQADAWKERVRGPAPSIGEGRVGAPTTLERTDPEPIALPPPQKMSKHVLGLDDYGNPNVEFGWGPRGTPSQAPPQSEQPPPVPEPKGGAPSQAAPSSGGYDPSMLAAYMNQAPQTAPMRVIPGGWQHASRSAQVQQAAGVDPEARAMYGQAYGGERAAVEDATNAGRQQAAQERGYLDQLERDQGQRLQMQRDINASRNRRIDEEMQKLQGAIAEAKNTTIDPDDFMRSRGEGAPFVAAIGGILGGLGAALTGGENQFTKQLNTQIGQSIAAQKANLENKHRTAENQANLIGQLQKQGMNQDQAEQGAWAMYLDQAKTQVAKIAAGSKDLELQGRAKAMLAAIDKEQAGRLQAFHEASTDKVVRQESDVYRPPSMAGGAARVNPELAVHMPDGTVRIAPDAGARSKAQAAVVFTTKMKQINQEALSARAKRREAINAGDFKSAQAWDDTLKQMQQDRIYTMSKAQEQGVVRDNEFVREARVVDVSGFDWNPLTAGHTNKFLEEEQSRWDRIGENEVRTWAPEVAQHGYQYNAQGQLAPINQYTGEARTPPKYTTPSSFEGVKK